MVGEFFAGDSLPSSEDWEGDFWPGSTLNAYMRAVPWTTPEVLSGTSISCEPGDLHDGYQRVLGKGGAAAFEIDQSVVGDTHFGWALFRLSNAQDQEVEASFSVSQTPPGSAHEGSFRGLGIGARVRDGSDSNSGQNDEYRSGLTGYFLCYGNALSANAGWFLFKVQSGTVGLLASKLEAGAGQEPPGVSNWLWPARKVRMTVVDEGGDVRLHCFETNYAVSSAEVELFSSSGVLDNGTVNGASLNGLLGRAAVGIQQPRVQGNGGVVVPQCALFRASKLGPKVVMVHDVWRRAYRRASISQTDQGGGTGRSLMSMFGGDQHGLSSHRMQLTKEVVGPSTGLQLGGPITQDGGSNEWGWYPSQRIADAGDRQRRELECEGFNNHTSEDREWGVFLHGTFSGPPVLEADDTTGKQGYLAVVKYTGSGGTWSAELRHLRNDTSTVLFTADLSLFGLTLAGLKTLDFECQNIQGSEPDGDGIVSMHLWVNATAVNTWVAATGLEGVQLVGNYIFDGRTEATRFGEHEAFYFKGSKGTANALSRANSWTAKAPSTPPPSDSASLESVAVPGETDGATGTLETQLEWSVVRLPSSVVRQTPVLSGHTGTVRTRNADRRRWRVKTHPMDETERSALATFFDDHDGCELGFDWDPVFERSKPDKVHFVTEGLSARIVGPGLRAGRVRARGDVQCLLS